MALLLLERGAHLGGLLGIHVLQTLLEHGDLLVVLGLSGFLPCARIERGAKLRAATAVLIKPNQIGTLTETLEAIHAAHAHGMKAIVSHRSGETTDDFITDLAVAVRAEGLKAGAPVRGERVAKYNRLVEIALEDR